MLWCAVGEAGHREFVRFCIAIFRHGVRHESRRARAGTNLSLWVRRYGKLRLYGLFDTVRGNNIALNSAPIRMTSEMMYIQVSKATPTPSDP